MFESTSIKKIVGTSLALNAALACSQASAQEKTALDTLWGDETQVTAGLALHTAPRYMGANGSLGHVLPSVTIQRGIFSPTASRAWASSTSSTAVRAIT